MIGVGTTIEGAISSTENIRFDGILRGNLYTKGKVFIGESGTVTGEIKCKNCEVEGVIEGKIIVEELLSLRSVCKIFGDIKTGKLAIEPGAIFTGKCDMGGRKESPKEPGESKKEG
ncbi:MAG: polymer-forming cytoskeletal protein [Bacteroidales bacterium]|nr:polymer-forming cytoskeletal protein [Bacteroidales bacterium]MBN2699774.1 polymer-forming cytoskeletal protein [Bacteroidales bacterium]